MGQKILISGERANLAVLDFDVDRKALSIRSEHPSPFNASWIELVSSQDGTDYLVGLSEGEESGLLFSFKIDHAQKSCEITSQQPTLGAPAHLVKLHDSSALALGTYWGGSVALYPISTTRNEETILVDKPRTELLPEFPYKSAGHGPNKDRQDQCHVHQILEDKRGFIYAPDLGSDRVWILRHEGMKLDICGWLQCPPGIGPRHAVFNPDQLLMYVIGELSHTVLVFDLSSTPAKGVQPIDGFAPHIIPPTVQPNHQSMMDSAEICLHPTIPDVLYVSNRWERHIAEREPHLTDVPEKLVAGDAVAIILLSGDGKRAESTKYVRTNVDVIRGMRVSDDGRFVIVVGQEGGGVEVYKITGEKGDIWTLAASLKDGLESGIKHAVWL